MLNWLKNFFSSDTFVFFLNFFKKPHQIGAVVPSSDQLAKAMTKYVGKYEGQEAFHYLEAGAGTGVFTDVILEKMRPQDHLDIVEVDAVFCELLEKKYAHKSNVHICNCSILDWHKDAFYDVIISGLPLNAFDPSIVEAVLLQYQVLTKKSGIVTYFEYQGIPEIKKILVGSKTRENFLKTSKLISNFSKSYEFCHVHVWRNFPPAIVHYFKIR
ncbi:class I SAM-dependent methyltransferase [Parachlamydia acanthamoebae]|jgi:phospholipid N-methyltransferase|uniref:class I SAM-dependent methyltransferase n=1 Tax=Parachlamydia acanthamoebae TaxID=83552 RepID=UPI0001C179F8|nr:rRNA adenine N-6-methyltransferase family protein [Parachlamydia acanthamoebae]EFB42816.1 hypothetical protein pah_c002o066 [Parachlamydia acanthamoebae str. Hall's coccus]